MKVAKIITAMMLIVCTSLFLYACDSGSLDSGSQDAAFNVHFEVCAPSGVRTNVPGDKTVKSGDTVAEPTVSQVGSETFYISGWYEDAAYGSQWDFDIDAVVKDITLYAKWEEKFTVNYYTKKSVDTPVYSQTVKAGKKVTPADGAFVGHKVNGYYKDINFSEVFDFGKGISGQTSIYADITETLYLDAKAISKNFMPKAAPSGAGSTAGDIYVRSGENGESYAEVNFGYSTATDPCIIMNGVSIDITQSQILRITYKNLGEAERVRLFFAVQDADGNYLGGSGDDNVRMVTHDFTAAEKKMSADGEWCVMEFRIAELNVYWKNATYLSRIRFDSWYKSKSESDLSNVMYIKSIEGVSAEIE